MSNKSVESQYGSCTIDNNNENPTGSKWNTQLKYIY
ncbi:hypothetical protein DERF_008652 [Dermatophagoides farinae]|uniref:Uncharacterized protein n=1 Tax=Dermatophagoides farinae TaxID=6954 RepID=A0A922I0D2_DERFA|nr:hypothetical protein DERF_008652 [Dermatophagoides farinae]